MSLEGLNELRIGSERLQAQISDFIGNKKILAEAQSPQRKNCIPEYSISAPLREIRMLISDKVQYLSRK